MPLGCSRSMVDVAPVHAHDLPGDGQAQAAALALGLGGEERLQDPLGQDLGDALALVRHLQQHPALPRPGRDLHPVALAGGVAGVEQEVHQQVLQQLEVAAHAGQLRGGVQRQLHAGLLEAVLHHGGRGRAPGRRSRTPRPWACRPGPVPGTAGWCG